MAEKKSKDTGWSLNNTETIFDEELNDSYVDMEDPNVLSSILVIDDICIYVNKEITSYTESLPPDSIIKFINIYEKCTTVKTTENKLSIKDIIERFVNLGLDITLHCYVNILYNNEVIARKHVLDVIDLENIKNI